MSESSERPGINRRKFPSMVSIISSVQIVNKKMSKHQIESEPVVVSVPGFTNGLNKIERLFVPKFIKNLAEKKQFFPRSSDTFVIGFPKSGE